MPEFGCFLFELVRSYFATTGRSFFVAVFAFVFSCVRHIFLKPENSSSFGEDISGKKRGKQEKTDDSVEQSLLLSKCKAFFDRLKQLLAVSAGAQLATIPVQLLMLGTFTPVGIISSVLVVPLVSLFVILGVFAVLIVLVLPESIDFFKIILNFMCNIIVVLVQFFSRL